VTIYRNWLGARLAVITPRHEISSEGLRSYEIDQIQINDKAAYFYDDHLSTGEDVPKLYRPGTFYRKGSNNPPRRLRIPHPII